MNFLDFNPVQFSDLRSKVNDHFLELLDALNELRNAGTHPEYHLDSVAEFFQFIQKTQWESLKPFSPEKFYLVKEIESLVDFLFVFSETDEKDQEQIIFEFFSTVDNIEFVIEDCFVEQFENYLIEKIKSSSELLARITEDKYPAFSECTFVFHDLGDTQEVRVFLEKKKTLSNKNSLMDLEQLKNEPFLLHPSCLDHKQRITDAIALLKKHSPKQYLLLRTFSHFFVPTRESSFVSYSLQSLPGVSHINFDSRDFIDLLDDLTHENGHHYLNHFLNSFDMELDTEDKIFYSPWRNALRPLRGIYHAVFTFSMALYLFSDLLKADDPDLIDQAEREKIAFRFLEELEMIAYCKPQILFAKENNMLSQDLFDLLNPVFDWLNSEEIKILKMKGLKEIDSSDAYKEEYLTIRNQLEKISPIQH